MDMDMDINETTMSSEVKNVLTDATVPLDVGAVVEIVLKSLIYGTGVVGNILVIFLIILLREHRKVSHWYLLQLAFTDFLFLQTLPFKISQDINESWIYPVWACKALQTVLFINYYCSIVFLMVMALDRYLAVCHGLSSRVQQLRSNKYAYLITVSTWTLSLLLSIPVMLYSEPTGVSPGCVCTINFPKDRVWWCKINHYTDEEMDYCLKNVSSSIHGEACLNFGSPENSGAKNRSVNTSETQETEDNHPPFLPNSEYDTYLDDPNYGSEPVNSPSIGSNGMDSGMHSGIGNNESNLEIDDEPFMGYYSDVKSDTVTVVPQNSVLDHDSVSTPNGTYKSNNTPFKQSSKEGPRVHPTDDNLWKGQGTTQNEEKCKYDEEGAGWTGFLLFNFVMMFVLPLLVIGVCYSLIIKRLTKSVAGNSKNRERKRVTVMLAVLVVLFIVCWLPYHSVHIAKIIGISGTHKQSTLCTALSRITLILPYVNSALNPYLYNFLGTFKKRVRQVGQHSGIQSFLSATRLTKIVGRSSTSGQGSNSDSSRPKRSSVAPDFQQESLPMKTFRSEKST